MDGEWVGEHVTKDIYIETDGRHAFYAGGQTTPAWTARRSSRWYL